MKLKYYVIYLDGIDKSGKDTIAQYVIQLSKYIYTVNCRGVITQIAYDRLYNRHHSYDLTQQSNVINVVLDVDKEDWLIRCKLTNEPKINYEDNVKAFEDAINAVNDKTIVFRYNSSKMTAYQIAKSIVEKVHQLNGGIHEN